MMERICSRNSCHSVVLCRLIMLLMLSIFGTSPMMHAQVQNSGGLDGQIHDIQGYAGKGAKVSLASRDKGNVLVEVAGADGHFSFANLAVGEYYLTVSLKSFEDFKMTGIIIEADHTVKVDIPLQAAGTHQEVVVSTGTPPVDTQSATVGVLLDSKMVENLPIDGNNVIGMAALLPGVTNMNSPTTFTSDTAGPTYSTSGSRNNQNLQLLDGSMWSNLFYNTGLNYPPTPMLLEVSVQLNNYKAQYGRNSGSVFNVITKSGQNTLHGSLWEYLQNKAFNAADYISHVNPKLVQNQFGMALGGPILRDRLFYFMGFQDLRVAQQVTSLAFPSTYAERGLQADGVTPLPCTSPGPFAGQTCANFSASATTVYPVAQTLYNPASNSPTLSIPASSAFNTAYTQAGNVLAPGVNSPCVIELLAVGAQLSAAKTTYPNSLPNAEMPSVCFNPIAVEVLSRYVPVSTNYSLSTATTANQPRNDFNLFGRLDWNHGRHTVDARYYLAKANDATAPGALATNGVAGYAVDYNTAAVNFGNIGDTWILGPNTVNVFRAGYKRYVNDIAPQDTTDLNALGGTLALPARPSLPELSVAGRFTLGTTGSSYSHIVNEDIELQDTLTRQMGRHTLMLGAEWLWLQYDRSADNPGELVFNSSEFTRLSAGDFLAGLAVEGIFANQTYYAAVSPNIYAFVQDDWRASSRLTLNLGLRYELPLQWQQPNGYGATFVPGYQSSVFPSAPANLAFIGDPGHPSRSLVRTDTVEFGPRVGFSYDLSGRGDFVLRGGFGIVFDSVNASVVGLTEPYHYSATYNYLTGGLSNPLLGENPVPGNFNPANPQFTTPYDINFPDQNFLTPYTESINIGFQKTIRRSGTLEMNYVGKFSRHQTVPIDLNPAIYDCSGAFFQINPALYCPSPGTAVGTPSVMARVKYTNFGIDGSGIVDLASIGTGNYNGLQVSYRQRAVKGISLYGSYTYSRSMDILSNGQSTASAQPEPFNVSTNYGPSDFDAKHIANLGWVWKLPQVGQSHFVTGSVVNGWSFGGTFNARTGLPFNVTEPSDAALTGEPGQRAELLPGMNPNLPASRHRSDKVAEYFNTAAFGVPAYGSYSNIGRNSMRGPSYLLTNVSLRRSFNVAYWRGALLECRADAFNIFNTPNLANPNSSYISSLGGSFGKILSTVGSNGVVATNGRRLQLAMTLRY